MLLMHHKMPWFVMSDASLGLFNSVSGRAGHTQRWLGGILRDQANSKSVVGA